MSRAGRWRLATGALITIGVLLIAGRLLRPQRSSVAVPPHPATGVDALVFAEEGPDTTTFWLADAQNPSVRTRLVSTSHATNRSGEAALSPNGAWLAFTRLPPGDADPDHDAELWLLPLGGAARRLATGVDLLSFLIWQPNDNSLTFDRVTGGSTEVWREALDGEPAQRLQAAEHGTTVVPVGYDREGTTLLAARISSTGMDVVALRASETRLIAHARSGSGRDFILSPDRSRLAYLAADPRATGSYEARTVDLDGGSSATLGVTGGEDIGLAWRPDGTLTIGGVGAALGLRSIGASAPGEQPVAGFQQPLAWSPSGTRLALRQFSGSDTANPGVAQDLVLEPDGQTRAMSAVDPVRFVGWVSR